MFQKMIKPLSIVAFCTIATMVAFNSATPINAAGSITVNATSAKQTIKGFGGMNHPLWISDLTEGQRTTAFIRKTFQS
jgi:glucuronoarabinoxylan endo-1,4-beta-xylanase